MKRTATFLVMLLMATAGFAQMHKSHEMLMEKFERNIFRSNAQKADAGKYMLDSVVSVQSGTTTAYTYNAYGNPVLAERKRSLDLEQRQTWTYDAGQNMLSDVIYRVNEENQLRIADSTAYAYNAQGQMISEEKYEVFEDGVPMDAWRYVYTYYPDGNMETSEEFHWDFETGDWGSDVVTKLEYFDYATVSGISYPQLSMMTVTDEGQVIKMKIETSVSGTELTHLYWMSSDEGETWTEYMKQETTFDAATMMIIAGNRYDYVDGEWVLKETIETTSDNAGNISIMMSNDWNGVLTENRKHQIKANPSVPASETVNPYTDPDNGSSYYHVPVEIPYLITQTDEYMMSEEGWDLYETCTFHYTQKVGINYVPANSGAISVYPNPTTGLLRIGTANGIAPDVKLYSIEGALLLQSNSAEIDITGFASGIYIICVNGEYKKVVKR